MASKTAPAQDKVWEVVREFTEDPSLIDDYDFTMCPTRRDHTGPYHNRDVVAALMRADFSIGGAARHLGRRRNNLRDFILSNADVRELYEEATESYIDYAEANIRRMVMAGDKEATKFLLTTLGKGRGYSTRNEQTGADGAPLMPETVRIVAAGSNSGTESPSDD